MKKTLVYCDRCEKNDAYTVSIITDRRMDAAGSMENEHTEKDYCPKCLISAVVRLLDEKSYEDRATWLRKFSLKTL